MSSSSEDEDEIRRILAKPLFEMSEAEHNIFMEWLKKNSGNSRTEQQTMPRYKFAVLYYDVLLSLHVSDASAILSELPPDRVGRPVAKGGKEYTECYQLTNGSHIYAILSKRIISEVDAPPPIEIIARGGRVCREDGSDAKHGGVFEFVWLTLNEASKQNLRDLFPHHLETPPVNPLRDYRLD